MDKEYKLLLGCKWVDSGEKMDVINPYNGEVIGNVCTADIGYAKKAVDETYAAFEFYKKTPGYKRAEILHLISEGIKKRKEEIAKSISLEVGKALKESRIEAARAALTFEIASEEAKRIGGEVIPLDLIPGLEGRWALTRRFPIGPILGITPFNFPLNLVAHKIAPALASGNTIIIKPASKTPITALLLGEICVDSGVNDGVLSILPMSSKVAEELLDDERIRMLSFTGGASVGWRLKARVSKKKVVLELGGNAGVIVHSDADIEHAAKRCVYGAFTNAGQNCISVQRLYVHEDIYEKFMEIFLPLVKNLTVGDPLDETVDMGPMVSDEEAKRIESWVKEAVDGGAKILTGGRRKQSQRLVPNFFEPTVLINTEPDMKVSCMEAFAPIVTVIKYREFDDALRMVNDTPYGLQAGVFTNDKRLIFKAWETIEVGGIMINDVSTFRIDHMPYGGVKESGHGREGLRYAIEEMTVLRLLTLT